MVIGEIDGPEPLDDGLSAGFGEVDEHAVGIGAATPAAEIRGEHVLDGHGVAEEIGGRWRLGGGGLEAIGTEGEGFVPMLGSESILETEKVQVGLAIICGMRRGRPDGVAGMKDRERADANQDGNEERQSGFNVLRRFHRILSNSI